MKIEDIANVYACKYNEHSQFNGDRIIIVQDVNGGLGIMAFTSRRDFEAGVIDTWYISRPLMHNLRTGACTITCMRRYRKPSKDVLGDLMVSTGKMIRKREDK